MKAATTLLTLPEVPQLKQKRRGTNDDFAASFWSRVDQSGGADACWPWTGGKFDTGYGCVWFEGKAQKAHRVAWQLAHGPLGSNERALHHCDNPPCCNPYGLAHLFVGTMSDNTQDMVAKGRTNSTGRRKLTADQVIDIRERYAAGGATLKGLADEFGVTWVAIHLVIKRKTWTHVA